MRKFYKKPAKIMKISSVAYDGIVDFIGRFPAERGGMLGMDKNGCIIKFEADRGGNCNAVAYDPDIAYLNKVLDKWDDMGIEFCGFVHSHPGGLAHLSGHDIMYAGKLLESFSKLENIWLPIVHTIPDTGEFNMYVYSAEPKGTNRRNVSVSECEMELIGMSKYMEELKKVKEENRSSRVTAYERHKKKYVGYVSSANSTYSRQETAGTVYNLSQGTTKYATNDSDTVSTYSRVGSVDNVIAKAKYYGAQDKIWDYDNFLKDEVYKVNTVYETAKAKWDQALKNRMKYGQRMRGYDFAHLDRTRLIIVGVGGAASFVRNCARMGVGEFVLIDPDVINDANVATQDVHPKNIGKTKVEALAEDIVAINPVASVICIADKIENVDDKLFDKLRCNPIRWNLKSITTKPGDIVNRYANRIVPEKTVLLSLTDNFNAQTRSHRLGLNFELPTICAMEYEEGMGAEITYIVPDITPACHRCITSYRYDAYLKKGYKNNVTSENAPVFAAEFLNASLGHILLAVIFHGTNNQRWGKKIKELGNKNLIVLRMDNSFDDKFGDFFAKSNKKAGGNTGSFMLDSLFREQEPDSGQSILRPVCPDCGGTGDLRKARGTFEDTRVMKKELKKASGLEV
jgi:proteasome lid subunit RPN8/RPN11